MTVDFETRGQAMGRIAVVACLLFVGCNRGKQAGVTPEQRGLASKAVHKLREGFNDGACAAIYDEASRHFRSQSREDWLDQCKQLQGGLGAWQAFSAKHAIRCGALEQIVCVDGTAVFAKDRRQVEVAWLLEGGKAQLFWLALSDGGEWKRMPPLPGRRLLDPPDNATNKRG